MLTITPHTRVTELQAGPPALMRTLLSTGLFREGDDPAVMLGQLCWTFGFSPAILIMMLQSANVPEEIPPLDVAPFRDMPLIELVEHIEQVHHGYLREALPRLTALSAVVAGEFPGNERLVKLDREMQRIAAELDAHLDHEEEALFPMVRNLGSGAPVAATRCGSAVGGPIACMENDHEAAAQTLRRMRELTGDYTPPAEATDAWRELLAGLTRFDQDLQAHMYKENRVLFPRALDTQAGRAAGS